MKGFGAKLFQLKNTYLENVIKIGSGGSISCQQAGMKI